MTVIARRVRGIWLAYLLLVISGAAFFVAADFFELGISGYILGAVLCAIGLWELVDYLRVPSDIVVLEGRHTLRLPRGVRVDARNITNLSYRRASSRGREYNWGNVVISTDTAEYKLRFVDDCEGVESALAELAARCQSELEEFPLY